MGYAPMPQPMVQPVLPYSQPYPGQMAPPAPTYNYAANYNTDYSNPPAGQQNLPYAPPTDYYGLQTQQPYGGYGQQPQYGAPGQTYM